jgi:hypothetical protein
MSSFSEINTTPLVSEFKNMMEQLLISGMKKIVEDINKGVEVEKSEKVDIVHVLEKKNVEKKEKVEELKKINITLDVEKEPEITESYIDRYIDNKVEDVYSKIDDILIKTDKLEKNILLINEKKVSDTNKYEDKLYGLIDCLVERINELEERNTLLEEKNKFMNDKYMTMNSVVENLISQIAERNNENINVVSKNKKTHSDNVERVDKSDNSVTVNTFITSSDFVDVETKQVNKNIQENIKLVIVDTEQKVEEEVEEEEEEVEEEEEEEQEEEEEEQEEDKNEKQEEAVEEEDKNEKQEEAVEEEDKNEQQEEDEEEQEEDKNEKQEEAVEEDEEEVEDEDDDDVEYEEVEINGKSYCTNNKLFGTIYELTEDGDVGDKVGRFDNGVVKFNKKN